MKRSILSICILLASVSLVFANIYKKYDVRSGLSGNCVRSILQDSIGYSPSQQGYSTGAEIIEQEQGILN